MAASLFGLPPGSNRRTGDDEVVRTKFAAVGRSCDIGRMPGKDFGPTNLVVFIKLTAHRMDRNHPPAEIMLHRNVGLSRHSLENHPRKSPRGPPTSRAGRVER
jgi:hypothetical protein